MIVFALFTSCKEVNVLLRVHDAPVPVVPLGCCCTVNIGQALFFLLLFAFDCQIKGVYNPRYMLMITLY